MGRPKLLLPIRGGPLIAGVVRALSEGGVDAVVVIVPPADGEGSPELRRLAEGEGARVIVPDERPADMRASFLLGLRQLERLSRTGPVSVGWVELASPTVSDVTTDGGARKLDPPYGDRRSTPPESVLLVPGDSPGLKPEGVRSLIVASERWPGKIVVPAVGGKRGHPVVFPWEIAREVEALPADVGINALLKSRAADVVEIGSEDPAILDDLDTPEDYRRWM